MFYMTGWPLVHMHSQNYPHKPPTTSQKTPEIKKTPRVNQPLVAMICKTALHTMTRVHCHWHCECTCCIFVCSAVLGGRSNQVIAEVIKWQLDVQSLMLVYNLAWYEPLI